MNKKMWKSVGKGIIFFALICMIMLKTLDILNYKSTGGGGGWQNFYDMPKNTADVMFFGSSHAHCTFDHGLLWDEYGMAGFTLTAGSQMIDSTYYFVKEAIEIQKPKVVVVETWGAVRDEIKNKEENIYRNSLGMRWSLNHWKFVNDMVDHMEQDSVYRNRVWLKIPVIHSRYAEVDRTDFENTEPFMRGYRGSFDIASMETPNVVEKTKTAELDIRSEEYIDKIIQLAKDTNTELIFVAAPFVASEKERCRFNKINQIAEKAGIPMIDYNHLYNEIGIDFSQDFRDVGHLNNYGAAKVTKHIAEYLRANYTIPDRRGAEEYTAWDLNSRFLRGKTIGNHLKNITNINEYLQALDELDEYSIILSLNGNHTAAGDVYSGDLEKLDIGYDDYLTGGIWVLEDGEERFRLEGKNYKKSYDILGNSLFFSSQTYIDEENTQREKVEIILDGKNYASVENGINILVYDSFTESVIDYASVDIYVGFDIVRD